VPERPALEIVAESDEDLLCRVAERDDRAFEALYHRYARAVFALALRSLRDHHRAEDAVQDAFAAIWRSAASYRRERGRAAPWLFRVARNVVIDVHRAKKRIPGDPVADLPDVAAAEAAPEDIAGQEWTSFQVHAAVGELPERERALIELAYWRGHSQSEIARQLELPLGTVKTRTRSALAHLAARLEGTL
jgi:RNA polymerase sigma-70 factor, ECF subfamily